MRPLRSTLTALVLTLVLVLAAAPTALAAPISADPFGWLSAVWQAVTVWLPGGGDENGCMIDPNGGCVPSEPSGLAAGATAEPEQPAGSDSTSSMGDPDGGNLEGDEGPGLDPHG